MAVRVDPKYRNYVKNTIKDSRSGRVKAMKDSKIKTKAP
jgi:hypothetical protein